MITEKGRSIAGNCYISPRTILTTSSRKVEETRGSTTYGVFQGMSHVLQSIVGGWRCPRCPALDRSRYSPPVAGGGSILKTTYPVAPIFRSKDGTLIASNGAPIVSTACFPVQYQGRSRSATFNGGPIDVSAGLCVFLTTDSTFDGVISPHLFSCAVELHAQRTEDR